MPLLDQILGGGVGQFVNGLIDKFHMSPDDKAKFQAAVDANQKEIQLAQIEAESKAQDTLARETEAASGNIRAEAASGDKYTSRARPSFIYVVLAIILGNYLVFPLAGKAPVTFPDAFFWLFGSCMLGYTGARTWEKVSILGQGK
jgi:Holin of 3TMs, for gene-transfer release